MTDAVIDTAVDIVTSAVLDAALDHGVPAHIAEALILVATAATRKAIEAAAEQLAMKRIETQQLAIIDTRP